MEYEGKHTKECCRYDEAYGSEYDSTYKLDLFLLGIPQVEYVLEAKAVQFLLFLIIHVSEGYKAGCRECRHDCGRATA